MQIAVKCDIKQKAENWVSKVVLVGCVFITVGLVYISMKTNSYGQEMFGDRNVELYLD